MILTPGRTILGTVCGLLCGAAFFLEAVHILAVRNAPIVTGHIIAREPIREFSVPRADFTIWIDGPQTEVHAHVQRYLIAKVPDVVRFHYSGDPAREVFLHEHEENPYWIVLTCWGVASVFVAILVASRWSGRIRRSLGWEKRASPEPAA